MTLSPADIKIFQPKHPCKNAIKTTLIYNGSKASLKVLLN